MKEEQEIKLTQSQEKAISQFEVAIKALKKAKIKICGMDHDLYYATEKAIDSAVKEVDNYCDVAEAYMYHVRKNKNTRIVGALKTNGVYDDSGGW